MSGNEGQGICEYSRAKGDATEERSEGTGTEVSMIDNDGKGEDVEPAGNDE